MRDFNLDQIPQLSEEAKNELEIQNEKLEIKAGAIIQVDKVEKELLHLSVKNVNGKRISKYELFDFTYSLFSKYLPKSYRLIIKV